MKKSGYGNRVVRGIGTVLSGRLLQGGATVSLSCMTIKLP